MKSSVFLVLLASVFASPAFIAQAAEQSPPKQQSAAPAPAAAAQSQSESAAAAGPQSGSKFITEESGQQMLSSNLVGMSVTNANKDDIGKIDNLVLDKDGRLTGVVVSVGGFLGIGSKHVALPMSEIQLNAGQKDAVVKLSKDDLKNAPSFKTKEEQDRDRKEEAHAQQSPAAQRHNMTPPPPEHTGAPAPRALPPRGNEK